MFFFRCRVGVTFSQLEVILRISKSVLQDDFHRLAELLYRFFLQGFDAGGGGPSTRTISWFSREESVAEVQRWRNPAMFLIRVIPASWLRAYESHAHTVSSARWTV